MHRNANLQWTSSCVTGPEARDRCVADAVWGFGFGGARGPRCNSAALREQRVQEHWEHFWGAAGVRSDGGDSSSIMVTVTILSSTLPSSPDHDRDARRHCCPLHRGTPD